MVDMRIFVGEGRSDEEIIETLELPVDDPYYRDLIGWIRSRSAEE